MATSYNRRINLFINGQQVSNDVRSIRAEMQKLVNEQARMTLGSQEYIAHARRIRDLRTILAEHNQQIAAVSRSWSMAGVGDAFNRYFAMVTAVVASITGLIMGFKALVKTFNDYEERVDNLSALTGLAGTSLDWLSQKAKDLSTATIEGGIRVTQGAQEIIDAFTKTGSARPELLKNKEALAQVTQEAIILSNAAKTTLQPAIEALTMVMNQYNVPASEARRIINALGAGSKEGAGEIPYLTTAFEKAGTVAANAGLSIETMVATIETLAPRISQPEIAGRSLKGVLLDLQQGADDINPSIVGMTTALENLGKKNLSITELTKMFGKENITTAAILINNVEELKKYEKAVTGTNIAIEQAAINTDNNNAKLAQARNRINIVSIELGEKLSPAMSLVTGYFGKTLKFVSVLVDVFTVYGRTIITATAAIVGYTLAVKLQTMWINRSNQATLGQIIASKAHAIITTAEIVVTQLWAAAMMVLTGNLRGANQALRVLTNTMKLNPIGLLTTAVIAGASALQYYTQKKKEAAAAANVSNQILEEEKMLLNGYSSEIVKERDNLNAIVGSIIRTNENEELRSTLIKKLKDQYPAFLGMIENEKVSNDLLAIRLSEVNNQYSEKIRLAALKAKGEAINNAVVKAEERKLAIEERLVQIEKESYRTDGKKKQSEVTALNAEYNQLNLTLSDYKKRQEEITTASTQLDAEIREYDTLPYVEKQLSGLLSARKTYGEGLKKAMASENKDEIAHYQKQLNLTDAQIKLFEDKREALLASAKQIKPVTPINPGDLEEGEGSGSEGKKVKKTDAEKDAEKLRKFFELDDEEQKDAIRTELSKLGKEGVAALAKGIEDEMADAKDTNKLLTEMMTPEKEKVDEAGDYALKKYYETVEGQKTLLMAQHEAGLISEQEFQDKIVEIQKKAIDEKLEKQVEGAKKYQEVTTAAANFVSVLMEAELADAGDNEEKKKQIKKKYADANMVVTIGQIISATALGIMQSFAQLGPVAGAIAAAFIGTTGAVQVAMAVSERNRMKSLHTGGFTGDGGKYEPAGIVHKGEYVIPQEGVNNPRLQPLISLFETARRNHTLARLELSPVVQTISQSRGYASGGFTSPASFGPLPYPAGASENQTGNDPELKAAVLELNRLLKAGIQAKIPRYGTNGLSDALDDINRFNSKVYKK